MRGFVPGFVLGCATIAGCASIFPYRYYNTQMPPECYDQGRLLGKLGPEGWPDLSLADCKPDPEPSPGSSIVPKRQKCTTLLDDDFYSLKADDEKCHEQLKMCQNPEPMP